MYDSPEREPPRPDSGGELEQGQLFVATGAAGPQLKESSSRPPGNLERVPEAASSRDAQDQGASFCPHDSLQASRSPLPRAALSPGAR